MNNTKKIMTKVLAPVAKTTAEKSADFPCYFFFNQPKLPKKLMHTVK